MAFGGMILAWFGATLWLGALGVRQIIASGEAAVKGMVTHDEYTKAMHQTRRHLHWLIGIGTSIVVASTMGLAVSPDKVTPLQAAASVSAALTLLSLMFHVERSHRSQLRALPQALITLLSFSSSVGVLIITTLPLLPIMTHRADMVSATAVIAASGAMMGTTLASITLRPLLAPPRGQILADMVARWTLLMGNYAAVLAIAECDRARQVESDNHLLLLISAIVATIPLILVIALRVAYIVRLGDALVAMPIMGMRDRSLHARARRLQAAITLIMRLGIGGTLGIFVLTSLIVIATVKPTSKPSPHMAAAATATPRPIPTITPVSGHASLMLTQDDNDISITLTGGPLVVGENNMHFAIANGQGQPIPGASVIVVINMMLSNVGGTTLQAQPDAAGDAAHFSATITVTRPGTWQIVTLVATADQSLHASAVFAVNVAG